MKRGRIKSNKEYAIILTHPELGEFYYAYTKYPDGWYGFHYFVFTKNLSRVKKLKTLEILNNQIDEINDKVKNKEGVVHLQIDNESIKNDKVIVSRKKNYYPVNCIYSESSIFKIKEKIEKIKEIISCLNESIEKDKEYYNNLDLIKVEIKNEIDIENISKYHSDILSRINSIKKNIKNCKSYQTNIDNFNTALNEIKSGIRIDIVDASFNFRLKKLKALKIIEEKEEK